MNRPRRLLAGAVLSIAASAVFVGSLFFFSQGEPASALGRYLLFSCAFAFSIGVPAWVIMPRAAPRFRRYPPVWKWTALISTMLAITTAGCLAGICAPRGTLGLLLGQPADRVAAGHGGRRRIHSLRNHAPANGEDSARAQDQGAGAPAGLERMAALLRFSLDSRQAGLVELTREMKIVRDYLEIEKVRFGDRLRYDLDVPGNCERSLVPPLSIQTLVENSVKYAVASRRASRTVVGFRTPARSTA